MLLAQTMAMGGGPQLLQPGGALAGEVPAQKAVSDQIR
jgi:hypothetical protein